MKIIKDNNIDSLKWQELIQKSSTTSFFQTKECYDFYCSLSFLEPFAFGVEKNNNLQGVICGYIVANGGKLKRFFSRRAIIHGGPLLSDDISDETLTELLLSTKKELEKKSIYIEIRNNHNYNRYKDIFEKAGFVYHSYLNYVVDTKGNLKDVFSNLSESKRRQVRKAKEFDVKVVETKESGDIDEFYKILNNLYKWKVKKPLFPKEFFEKAITLRHTHLLVAKYRNQVIGGIFCVEDKNTIYEWFVCGNKEAYNHLYPSVAVTYAAIEYATKNGFRKFDFMGAGKLNENYGVREFKEKFGGNQMEFGRFVSVNNKLLYSIGKTVIRILQNR